MKRPMQWLVLNWIVPVILLFSLGVPRIAPAADESRQVSRFDEIDTLDLQTAARIALAGNPTLAVARSRVEQARQAVLQARSAYYPRLDFNAAASRVDLSDNSQQAQLLQVQSLFGFSTTIDDPEDFYSAGLTASWVVFDGFARKFNLATARFGEQISVAVNDDVRRLLLQSVIGAFLSAQLAFENITIARADEAFNQRQLTEARLRYDVGTGALSDVLNFEVRANSAIADRIVAEQVYQTSRIGLAALLGVADTRIPDRVTLSRLAPASSEELAALDPEALLSDALSRRPDLRQGQLTVQQAEAGVKVRRADYYPTLALSATYEGERAEDPGFESDDFGNTVALSLRYNIFAGGLFKARLQEAKARLIEAQKAQESVEIDVSSQVRATAERVVSAQKQLSLQRTNADLVKRNRDLVEKEYKAGVGSLVRLNEAQRDLIRAQVGLATARAALHQAGYDLQSATGRILESFAQER